MTTPSISLLCAVTVRAHDCFEVHVHNKGVGGLVLLSLLIDALRVAAPFAPHAFRTHRGGEPGDVILVILDQQHGEATSC